MSGGGIFDFGFAILDCGMRKAEGGRVNVERGREIRDGGRSIAEGGMRSAEGEGGMVNVERGREIRKGGRWIADCGSIGIGSLAALRLGERSGSEERFTPRRKDAKEGRCGGWRRGAARQLKLGDYVEEGLAAVAPLGERG